jgi:hypothetical protein
MHRIAGPAGAGSVFAAAFALALGIALGAPQAEAKDPFGGQFDHYQCYSIRDSSGKPLQTDLTLKDQFRADKAATVRATLFCNPVDKNGEGIPQPKVHLVCYTIKVATPDKNTYHVKTTNQLETNDYYVSGPQLICVPSLKEVIK